MCNRAWSGIISCAAVFAVFLAAAPLRAEISVEGNVEARNQSGVHDGEVYRNYLKCDVDLRKNFGDTEVKVTLRAEDGLAVVSDREKLGTVLSNLISNALKHTPPGGAVEPSTAPLAPSMTNSRPSEMVTS